MSSLCQFLLLFDSRKLFTKSLANPLIRCQEMMRHGADIEFPGYFLPTLSPFTSLFPSISYVHSNGFLKSIDKALINVGDTLEAVAESIVNYGENVVNLVR